MLAAGDTLNDLSMLSASFHGVCVGQSEAALLEATRSHSRTLHASRPGCGGILEAFAHFGFLGEHGIAAERRQAAQPGKAELVMVYHRLPYEEYRNAAGKLQRRRPTSPNGIIPTLLSFFGDGRPGSWVAWAVHEDGDEPFDSHTTVDAERYPEAHRRTGQTEQGRGRRLLQALLQGSLLADAAHLLEARYLQHQDDWQVFLKVNRAFAERTALEAAEGAIVWLHDYNLWMVPAYLRELRPDLRIASSTTPTSPRPTYSTCCPGAWQIVGSLLQCDYIGFHIPRQVENFVDVARGVFPLKALERQSCAPRFITYWLRRRPGAHDHRAGYRHPSGQARRSPGRPRHRPRTQRPGSTEDPGADGEPARGNEGREADPLGGAPRLHQGHPGKARTPTNACWPITPNCSARSPWSTVCEPAAREMTVYNELQTQIERAVGRINGRFARIGWTPLQFFFRSLPFEEVSAWYAMADVMWITPAA